MEKPIENYWKIRLRDLKEALEANNFDVFVAQDTDEAKQIIRAEIIAKLNPQIIAWGGSMTFTGSGLYDELKSDREINVLDTFEKDIPAEEMLERRRQALLADLFITGTNAVTEEGQLVNLDMIGNRVGALTFGPKHVVVMLGRNKIVADLEDAMVRIKDYVAPTNSMRLDKKTPCVKTGCCEECKSPDRICNTWTITEKAFPKGRVKVVIINQDLGL